MNRIQEFHKLEKKRRKRFQRRYCLHPDAPKGCSGDLISAHSVQKALISSFLAEEQHVLKFVLEADPKASGAVLFAPDLVGINKATTFNGFCGFHDDGLFKPLEANEFQFSPEQIALMGFRAFSRELYSKDAQLDVNTMLKDHMLEHQELQTLDRLGALYFAKLGLENAKKNLRTAWENFGQMVTTGDLSSLRYFAARFDFIPPYLASTAFLPEWNFEGNRLQNLDEIEEFHGLAFSAWAANEDSTAVLCWHESADKICIPFVQSLQKIDDSRLANRILSMAFEESENVIMRPSWWEGLKDNDKDLLTVRVPSGMNSKDRREDCLADDGLEALPCGVKGVFTNL